jgi:hypothetical protein
MDVVYAKSTGHYSTGTGHTVLVVVGSHWPANDPLVRQYPDTFSDDPAYGLNFSVPPLGEAPVTDGSTKDKPNLPSPPSKGVEQTTAAPGEKRAR